MTFPLDNSMTEAQRDDGTVSVLSQPPKAWGEARTAYPRDATIAQLFEEVADANAARTALVCGSTEITYSELNSQANRLASELRRLGVGPESF